MENTIDNKFLRGHVDETWKEAIERFQSFCATPFKMESEGTNEDSHELACQLDVNEDLVKIEKQVPVEDFVAFEANYKVTIPKELKELLHEHGSFKIGQGEGLYINELLHIYGSDYQWCFIMPFLDGLANNWTHHIKDSLLACSMTQEQIDQLNKNCFIFGCIWRPQGGETEGGLYTDIGVEVEYLCFDKQGNYFTLCFFHEDLLDKTVQMHILPTAEGKYASMSLNQIISYAVDRVINDIIIGDGDGNGNFDFRVLTCKDDIEKNRYDEDVDEIEEEEEEEDEEEFDIWSKEFQHAEVKLLTELNLDMPALPKAGQSVLQKTLTYLRKEAARNRKALERLFHAFLENDLNTVEAISDGFDLEKNLYVCFKGLRISGDWDVNDSEAYCDCRLWEQIGVIYCDGDLVIEGDLINDNWHMVPALIVTGDLHVRSWLRGGMTCFVGGNVFASGVLYGEYNDGRFYVGKDLHAMAYIINLQPGQEDEEEEYGGIVFTEEFHSIGGAVNAKTVDFRQEDAYKKVKEFVPEALTSNGKKVCCDPYAMFKLVAKGRSVWAK
jgi:hypothetical protein